MVGLDSSKEGGVETAQLLRATIVQEPSVVVLLRLTMILKKPIHFQHGNILDSLGRFLRSFVGNCQSFDPDYIHLHCVGFD